jgi:hypothetical protein
MFGALDFLAKIQWCQRIIRWSIWYMIGDKVEEQKMREFNIIALVPSEEGV